MTDQLDSRATGMVTAVMDDEEHPIRQAIATPADGVGVAKPDDTEAADSGAADTGAADTDAAHGVHEHGPADDAVADADADAVADTEEVTDTGTIVLPSPEILADPAAVAELVASRAHAGGDDEHGYPHAPERGSLDDDDLVPLVDRHTDDTATIDLIGILQAQLQLRSREAERFADWEERMRQIGTAEALGEVERTRLHFTGVIPVQVARPLLTTDLTAPPSTSLEKATPDYPRERLEATPVIGTGTAPSGETLPAADAPSRERTRDEEVLEHAEPTPAPTSTSPAAVAVTGVTPSGATVFGLSSSRRILVPLLSLVAALVVVAALVLTAVGSAVGAAAALAALGVVAAAWLGIVAARLALRPRSTRVSAPVTSRTAWALVAGLVVGTAVGEGLIRTTSTAFSWQGYLLRLVDVQGMHAELSVVAGIVAALVLAFVIVVLVDRSQQPEPTTN